MQYESITAGTAVIALAISIYQHLRVSSLPEKLREEIKSDAVLAAAALLADAVLAAAKIKAAAVIAAKK
jgi:hypothetical protein